MHAFILKDKIATIEILHETNNFNALFKTQNNPIEWKLAQKVIYVTNQLLIYTDQEIYSQAEVWAVAWCAWKIKHSYMNKTATNYMQLTIIV